MSAALAGELAAAFAGRRVLVTGHTGFKGGWLCLWLSELGAEVCGYALEPPSTPSFFEATGLGAGLRDERGDILDAARLEAVVADFAPEAVFHLAAQPIVRESYRDPVGTIATNVLGTARVLEAARQAPSVRALVNITSDKCYENREWVWGYRESDPMGGRDPYSASKGCAELIFSAWQRSFFEGERGLAAASARAGNVIGGGDWGADRLIPDAMRALSAGEELIIRSPSAVRPWQHVLDPLSGYLCLGARLLTQPEGLAGGWNFGPADPETWTVEEVSEEALRLWGAGRLVVTGARQPHEARWLQLDCRKAQLELGWRAQLSVAEAIAWTVEWHKAFAAGEDVLALSRAQLRRYTEGRERPATPAP